MKKLLTKYSSVYHFARRAGFKTLWNIEYISCELIIKEMDKSRLSDFKQALSSKRYHNISSVMIGCNK